LRGPRGGIILCKKELAEKIDKGVMPGLMGGPHINAIAAKAVALEEAMSPKFVHYQQKILDNAQQFVKELRKRNFKMISEGTDTHLILIDLTNKFSDHCQNGKDAEDLLEQCGITSNKNMIPFDQRSPFSPSGLRIGTAAISNFDFNQNDIRKIIEIIDHCLMKKESLTAIKKQVLQLCEKNYTSSKIFI
jgi:glycine hydroxymethyltransferase